jgi:hypothetical protein
MAMKPSPQIRGGQMRRDEFSGCRGGRKGVRSAGGRQSMRKTLLIPAVIAAAVAAAMWPRRAY